MSNFPRHANLTGRRMQLHNHGFFDSKAVINFNEMQNSAIQEHLGRNKVMSDKAIVHTSPNSEQSSENYRQPY